MVLLDLDGVVFVEEEERGEEAEEEDEGVEENETQRLEEFVFPNEIDEGVVVEKRS